MSSPDKTSPETLLEQDPEKLIQDPEKLIQDDMDEVEGGQRRVGEILEGEGGDPEAEKIRKESRGNVDAGKKNLSDFEKEKYERILEKIDRGEELPEEEQETIEKEYERIYKKINRNERLPENEREGLSENEKEMLKKIGTEVNDVMEEDESFTVWREEKEKYKKTEIKSKNNEFKKTLGLEETSELKKGEKEIKEAREEITKKRKKIEEITKKSIEEYKEMEDEFGKILKQDKACDILNEKEKDELQRILSSLSAVVKNEIDITKLKYIEAELDHPDKLLRDHPYRLAKIRSLEEAADFFDNGLERLGEKEGDLLEKFLEYLKDHPELLEIATLIALLAGFALLAEPAAEVIAGTEIMLKIAGAVKSAAILGSLVIGYTLLDEKQRDWIAKSLTGTEVPNWAWLFSEYKYGQETK